MVKGFISAKQTAVTEDTNGLLTPDNVPVFAGNLQEISSSEN